MLRLKSAAESRAASVGFISIVCFLFLLMTTLGLAQTTPGLVPYSSYKFDQYDTISNADLNQMITIPVRSKAGLIPFQANLVMNSSLSPAFQLQIAGTGDGFNMETDTHCPYQPPDPPEPTKYYHGFHFTDATGALHNFPDIAFDTVGCLDVSENTGQIETSGAGLQGFAATNTDGSLKYFEVVDRSGNVFNYNATNPNALVTDRNGNTLSMTKLSSYGPTTATTGADIPIGNPAWSNPGDVAGTSGYASVTVINPLISSDELRAGGFSFSVPPGAYILGIQVTANVGSSIYSGGGTSGTLQASLYNNGVFGTRSIIYNSATQPPLSPAQTTFGGPSDLWGNSIISPNQFNGSSFYVSFVATAGQGTNNQVVEINDVSVAIYILPGTVKTYTDSMGQVVLTQTFGGIGPPRGADTYTYLDANGVNQTVSVNYSQYTQQTAWGCGSSDIPPTSKYFPSSVSYPDGTSLSLTYEHGINTNSGTVTGRVASITLPTGGTISYGYIGGNDGKHCDGSPATLTRTENGQTATYVHTLMDQNYHATTVETLPDGGTETFLFAGGQYGILATFLYSDVVQDSSGNITSTRLINFNGLPNGTPRNGPLGAPPPISQTDIYTYKGGTSVTAGSVHTQTTLDSNYYALPTDAKVYLPATSSTVYTDTATTYGSFTGSGCTSGAGNDVCTSVTTDGSGNTLKSSRYTYDSFWNQLSASALVGGTAYLSSSKTYNSNGTVATSTSVFGNVSTNSVTSCDNTLPTSTSNGVTNYSYAWDCNGGVMNSVNNSIGTTSFAYNDPLYRTTQSTDETGIAVNYSFTATSGEGTTTFGSSTEDGVVNVDGFGHKLSTQVKNGSSYDTTSHTYLGDHVASDSLPCSTTLNGTCATTKYTYSYDSVGRMSVKTDVTTSATRVYSYNANDILMIVSGGTSPVHKVQTELDGLGRMISVCEITTLAGSASCGQTTAATGFLTTYQYTPIGLLSTITQFANGSTPQVRSFAYDDIGRKLTENTPESGLVQFFYDTAPSSPGVVCPGTYNGKLVKRYDARGNTTCYAYDSIGRTSSVVYSGPGSTGGNKYFVYDTAIVNGQTMANATEKMAEAYTATSVHGTKLTDLGFSYDLTGRVTDVYESTPSSGGYYHTTATYYGNGTVKTLGGVPGKPTWSFGLDPMGRFKTMSEASNCNGSCLTLVSSTSYNLGRPSAINYGSGDSDSFVYSATTGMESSYTLKQGSNKIADTLTWFPTGQLQKQVFSDTVTPASAQTCTYTYDQLLRLTSDNCGSIWSQTFTYDAFGNMAKTGNIPFVPTYNNKNQISNLGSTYDPSGNLLTINNGILDTYTWDAENRVASIDGKTLTYDALDRVVEEGPTLQILYGPTGKMGVQSGQTNTRTYLGLPKGAGVIYDGSSVVYQHPDLMGNGILGTNNAKGKVFDRFFAPFGEVYNNSGATVADFTGKTQDLDASLYDFTFREESPAQGRWLNPDPSGMSAVSLTDPQTLNRYAYVRGSAMGLTDVNGLSVGVDRGLWAYVHSFDMKAGDGGFGDNNLGLMTADVAAAEQLDAAQAAAKAAAQNQADAQKPPHPPQTDPKTGKPTPPPVPVPGCPTCGWVWHDDKKNPRGGRWDPTGWKGPNPPNGSWDPEFGHWDINGGKGEPVDHYDPKGNPITPGQAHPGNIQLPSAKQIGIGIGVGVIGYGIYRGVRMLPSLTPPLWWTIPLNAAIP